MSWGVVCLDFVVHELTLFAAAIFLIFGAGDLAIDLIWIGRSLWRRLTIYRRYQRTTFASLGVPAQPGRIVVFVPAWDESKVIAPMLSSAIDALGTGDWRIYVGTYPNDAATLAAVAGFGPRVRLVVNSRAGPTTKADNLNAMWRALLADEIDSGVRAKAVVLHDAEDKVHAGEYHLFDWMIERFDMVQLPVRPLPDSRSRWVGGHYLDEFADAHVKNIVVREALGAGIPSAGVGCAISRAMLGRIAAARGGNPFDADSLTEDYELGLRIRELGGRGAFVRLPMASRAETIAVHAHFPATLECAVRQKARWIAGIALSGWDRLGWHGGWVERWMRLHDRRALVAALALLAAYAAFVLNAGLIAYRVAGFAVPEPDPWLRAILTIAMGLLGWRLLMRAGIVTYVYGWREGLRAVPRTIVGNIIAMLAARRAVGVYLRMRREGVVRWDKTEHRFPVQGSAS